MEDGLGPQKAAETEAQRADQLSFSTTPPPPSLIFFLINLFTYICAFAGCSLTECPAKFTVHIIPSGQPNALTGLHTKIHIFNKFIRPYVLPCQQPNTNPDDSYIHSLRC